MKKRNFGRTGLTVSELCFGTMNFGWTIDRATAFALLDTYYAAGGSFLQSVHVCGDVALLPDTFRAPEAWIGEWMHARSIPRDTLIISSRVTLLDGSSSKSSSLSADLKRCCESLLRRMGLASLDLLIIEWNNRLLPADEAALALASIKQSGLVRHVAFANPPNWRVMESLAFSSPDHSIGGLQTSFSIQSRRDISAETLSLCNSYDLGLTVTSTLGGGHMRLRTHLSDDSSLPHTAQHDYLLRLLSTVAAQRSGSVEQIALAWVLSHKLVSSVVTSVNTLEQLSQLIDAASWNPPSASALQPLSFKDSDAAFFSRSPRLSRLPTPKITL